MRTPESGAIIRYLKCVNLLTNQDIAITFNLHENTVWNWTKGKQRPSFDDLIMICDYYGVSVDEARKKAKRYNASL